MPILRIGLGSEDRLRAIRLSGMWTTTLDGHLAESPTVPDGIVAIGRVYQGHLLRSACGLEEQSLLCVVCDRGAASSVASGTSTALVQYQYGANYRSTSALPVPDQYRPVQDQ